MAERLRVVYSDCNTTANNIDSTKDDFQSLFNQINGAVQEMKSSWQGKGGRSFFGYWEGTGHQHSQAIINQLEKLDTKMRQIIKQVQDSDQETAALFRS